MESLCFLSASSMRLIAQIGDPSYCFNSEHMVTMPLLACATGSIHLNSGSSLAWQQLTSRTVTYTIDKILCISAVVNDIRGLNSLTWISSVTMEGAAVMLSIACF